MWKGPDGAGSLIENNRQRCPASKSNILRRSNLTELMTELMTEQKMMSSFLNLTELMTELLKVSSLTLRQAQYRQRQTRHRVAITNQRISLSANTIDSL